MREDDEKRPQLGSTPAPAEKPDLKRRILESKQRILSGMKGRYTGEETSRWLTSIEESPANAEETISVGGLVDESRLSMPALLDLLFDHLQRYTFELNKVATDPDMKIHCERPTSWQEKVEFLTKTRYMRGHLSTRYWSFIVWADESKADGYFIPTDFLVGFAPGSDFTPYITVSRMSGGGDDIIWGIDKKILSSNEVPRLARRLITQLVKVCTGEANSDDKFTFSSSDSVVQPAPSIDRSYEFELEGQTGSGLHSEAGGPPESRSQRLKRLMEDSARQEEIDRASGLGFVKRQVTVAERPSSDSGVFRAPGNGHEAAASASGSYPAAQGSTPTFQGFMPPGQTALPTPPGALGPPVAPAAMGQPPALGLPLAPGGLGQPPAAIGQIPSGLGQHPNIPGVPTPGPPSGFGMSGPPPGLSQNTPPAGPPAFLQPPGGLSLGPPPGFGDGAPSALPQALSSERLPVIPPPAPAQAPAPPNPASAANEEPAAATLRPPAALFGGGPPERARVNPALLPEESGMYKSIPGSEPAVAAEADAPSPWTNLTLPKPEGVKAPTSQDLQVPSLSDVTRAPAEPPPPAPEAPPLAAEAPPPPPPAAEAPPPTAEAPPAPPALPPASSFASAVAAFPPAAPVPDRDPEPVTVPEAPTEPEPAREEPAAPAPIAEAPRGLAGLVRKAALNDAAPPSPRKDSAAVQVDFGSADSEPEPPSGAPPSHGERKPTLQSLLKGTSDHGPAVSSDPNDIARLVNDAQKSALGNLSGIIQELDRAMKSLQEAGVEAMQGGNFESVQLVMENTKRLKATKDRLAVLLDEISTI